MSDTTETETDTNTNTDEPTKAELHDRVQQLESTVEKLMPSRRDALKLGAAGIAGAAGLGAASQSAEAATGSAGQIGDVNNRPDVFADDIDANTVDVDRIDYADLKNDTTEVISTKNTTSNIDEVVQNTTLVDTSATTICVRPDNNVFAYELTVVVRRSSSDYAIERVTALVGAGTTVSGAVTRGGMPARTYTISGGEVQLSLSSGTAQATVHGHIFEAGVP